MPLPIRNNVRRMPIYAPGKSSLDVLDSAGKVVKLSSNENPNGPSPLAIEALKGALSEASLYPDGSARELKQAIADKFTFPPDRVVLGNGSDEIIRMLGWILLGEPDDQVIVADPSFVVYDSAANLVPCELLKVPLNRKFEHDLPEMARKITPRTKIVFVANPNNPTGTVVRRSEVEAFLRDVPDSVLVVLDEAYYEFACHLPDFPNGLDYARQMNNVIALRTFSKAYGLAGLRCGYGFASAEVADAIERARQPFNVSRFAQIAASAALLDDQHVAETVKRNSAGLQRISAALADIGAKPCESYANFVWADFGRPVGPLVEALMSKGVIVRGGDLFGCPNCLRVSVGTDDQIDALVEALEQVLQEKSVR